ncbi:MAG: NAD(+)/NADH kinase [Thermoproteales archaeon]|nr:NAD(+)/NADH kinase [Thermoproteales archaeon]
MPLDRVYVWVGRHVSGEEAREVSSIVAAHGMMQVGDPASADLVLAIGDDRDILDAIQAVGDSDTPILGVSLGNSVSYLSSISLDELGSALEMLRRGEYELATHARLRGVVDGSTVVYAMNEIAVFPSRSATLMSYELLIDGDLVWMDRADGVLVATPLGSTAYALSAGGAVVLEGARVLEVVPVNSVDPSKRPLIVPDTSRIVIKNVSSRHPCEVVADGGKRVKVRREVTISRSEMPIRIVKVSSRPSVRETLREKIAAEAADMPPSAKFVLKMLELKGPMSAREIAELTLLPERTVRYALSELLRRGLVRRSTSLRDARQVYYELAR